MTAFKGTGKWVKQLEGEYSVYENSDVNDSEGMLLLLD